MKMKQIHIILISILCWQSCSSVQSESPIRPGDRIAILGNTFADQLRIHGYLETLLLLRSAENPVSIRNLGWGGDMLDARDRPTNFPSEESYLTDHKTDVIVACFGMGESFNGSRGLNDFRNQLASFIASHAGKKYNGNSEVRLILVSPIACEDLDELTPLRQERNRDLESYTDAIRAVASQSDVPFVDLFAASKYLMDEPSGPNLTTNGIHLNPYGYWAISKTLGDQLYAEAEMPNTHPWQLNIDASAANGRGQGVKLSNVTANDSGVSFDVTETSAPNLSPPGKETPPPPLQLDRDSLVVTKLQPGDYRLTVDENEVVTANAENWNDGVAIDSSPIHRDAEAYRTAVNDKNMQFTYSWKALNQVHIVGERRTSPSGRALPQEIIEFKNLASKRDAALRKGLTLKTRRWKLTRLSQ